MNKDSIYKLIGYNGEYNSKVKRAIRKLLKEYHPDRQGNEEIFKLINEVKKELETNKVTFNYDNVKPTSDFDDIDYDYCNKMICDLELQKTDITNKIKKNQEEIEKLNIKYRDLYSDNIDKKGLILNRKSNYNTKNIQIKVVLLCLTLIGFFTLFILSNDYAFLILFILGIIVVIYYLFYLFNEMNKLLIVHKRLFNSYLKSSQNIQKVLNSKMKLEKKGNTLKMDLKKIENDLRFYHNILKYK